MEDRSQLASTVITRILTGFDVRCNFVVLKKFSGLRASERGVLTFPPIFETQVFRNETRKKQNKDENLFKPLLQKFITFELSRSKCPERSTPTVNVGQSSVYRDAQISCKHKSTKIHFIQLPSSRKICFPLASVRRMPSRTF